jgi:anti-sigma regulatory factor (Ser/Thr protein kinase)
VVPVPVRVSVLVTVMVDARSDGSEPVETVLPATPASPGVARRFVGAALRRWDVDEPTIEAAQLLVSELVTNAIVHTSSEVWLVVSVRGGTIRVEVTDHDARLPELRPAGSGATDGRGLGIVDGIADAWGFDPRHSGKAVWFELVP